LINVPGRKWAAVPPEVGEVLHERHFERCPRAASVVDQLVVDQHAVDQDVVDQRAAADQPIVDQSAANERAADQRAVRQSVVDWNVNFAPRIRWRQRRPGSGGVRFHQDGGSAKRRVRAELKSPREQAGLIFNSWGSNIWAAAAGGLARNWVSQAAAQ
jgi:hypothetical protein